jgi:putative spermidine/putrescine transport system substrate-binding protein
MPSNRVCLASGAALAIAVALLVGVGSSSARNASPASAASSSLAGTHIVVETFGGNFDKQIQKYYIDPAEKATGLSATIDNPTDYGQLAIQVKTHNVQWAVVQGDPFFAIANCGTLLQPMASLVNRSQIQSKYLTDKCEVPGETYNFLFTYDKKKFGANPPTSWADFFNTRKYPGARGLWGSYVFNGALEGALLASGVPESKLYPLNLNRAFAKLDTIKSDVKFFDTLAQAQQLMESGEVSMIIIPGEIGVQADQDGADFAPVWNQQMESWDAYIVPKGLSGSDLQAAAAVLQQIASSKGQSGVITGDPTSGVTTRTRSAPAPTGIPAEFSPNIDNRVSKGVVMNQQWWSKNLNPVGTRWTQFASS